MHGRPAGWICPTDMDCRKITAETSCAVVYMKLIQFNFCVQILLQLNWHIENIDKNIGSSSKEDKCHYYLPPGRLLWPILSKIPCNQGNNVEDF